MIICLERCIFVVWRSINHQSSQPFMPLLADGLHNLVVGLNQETHHAGSGRLGGLASCHSGLTAWLCGRRSICVWNKVYFIESLPLLGGAGLCTGNGITQSWALEGYGRKSIPCVISHSQYGFYLQNYNFGLCCGRIQIRKRVRLVKAENTLDLWK